jgi:hypothetical protein
MDILNWLFTQDQNLIKTTINNKNTDLIAMAADVSFDKRSDKWQTYAMTAANFAPALYDTANVTQLTSNNTNVTVNAHTGVITLFGTINTSSQASFGVRNTKVTANSKIFLQLSHTAGISVVISQVTIEAPTAGTFGIQITNGAGAPLTGVKIHYMIID